MQYYEITVKFITETEEGKIKSVKEKYLVDSTSVEYANSKVAEFLKESPSNFEIEGIKRSSINEIIK